MRMRNLLVIVCCLIAAVRCSAGGLTDLDVLRGVAAFEGTSLADLQDGRVRKTERGYYEYRTPTGAIYDVAPDSGHVWRVSYRPGKSPKPGSPLTKTQAREVAVAYARKHFPTFIVPSTLEKAHEQGNGFLFDFWEVIPSNGALTGNFVSVVTSTEWGAVTFASITDEPTPPEALRQPAVTLDAAFDKAQKAAGVKSVLVRRLADLFWARRDGDKKINRLIWRFDFNGETDNGTEWSVAAAIDAQTGEPIQVQKQSVPKVK